jgi:tRNA pseudouridine55 synthase
MNIKNNGILLVDKNKGSTSFKLVAILRRLTKIEKIGHSGTLDPFATGLMVMLIGREFTKRSDQFLTSTKEYRATVHLGIATDTYDIDGQMTAESLLVPTLPEIQAALHTFQGDVWQIPPMFSAKKIKGQKLYDLARKGIEIERAPVKVHLEIELLRYEYPEVEIQVRCSKGTYIRSLAHDLGTLLGTGAHLSTLIRLRSGYFRLEDAISQSLLEQKEYDISPHIRLC